MNARRWMLEYGVAMVLAFLLASILGQIPLFRETSIGKLHASDLVHFIGYSGAAVTAWLGARQLADNPPQEWKWLAPFQAMILPLASLILVSLCYWVLLFPLGPFLGKIGKAIYNWSFVTAIISGSVWLVFSWVRRCAPLLAAKDIRKLRKAA